MLILADFNQLEIILEVKQTTSSLNIRLLRLSTENLSEGSLKDHLKPEIHLHFQVSLKIAKMAYFSMFHPKTP